MTAVSDRNPWIAAGKYQPQVERRLLCFPHAGGGSSLFTPWRSAFGPQVQVCPVVLPGREARLGSRPYSSMEELIEPLVEGLWELTDLPIALFGHSLGSIIAYEVARRFTALGRPPTVLLVSGRRAPHLPARLPDVHTRDRAGVIEALRHLGGTPEDLLTDSTLLEMFLPAIRADFQLNETYLPLPGASLTCDIAAYGGTSDPQLTRPELEAWGEVTRGGFTRHFFDGDHFYLQPPPARLLELVTARLG